MANGKRKQLEQRPKQSALVTALQSSMTAGTIYIWVDNNGNFTYLPTHYRARHGDQITFVSLNNSPFEVVFKDGTPGDKLYLSNRDPVLTITADDYSGYRVYHYAASVAMTGGDGIVRVFMDAACGDIGVGE